MELSEFAFRILLLFVPGLVCAFIVDSQTVHEPRQPHSFFLLAFIYGVISYIIYAVACHILRFDSSGLQELDAIFLKLTDGKEENVNDFSFIIVAWTTLLSFILAVLIIVLSQYKIINRLLRLLRITKQFGELDVWGFALNLKEVDYVTVRDVVNDLVYDGWVQAFSDDATNAQLLLRDVSVYRNESGIKLYQCGAIYLSLERSNMALEFRAIPVDSKMKWKEDGNGKQKCVKRQFNRYIGNNKRRHREERRSR